MDGRQMKGEPHAPIVSTRAVRLDSSNSFPPFSPPSATHLSHRRDGKQRAHDHAEPVAVLSASAALPAVFSQLRKLHRAEPSASPLDLVRKVRPIPFIDDERQPPPTPPPPIRLDPQPHRHEQRLLTPFLLQALFLGASALGLLTRRKVRSPDAPEGGVVRRENELAKQAAEDRVDEIQALNLLVSSYASPDIDGVMDEGLRWEWRREATRPLLTLVAEVERRSLPVGAAAVAAVLQFVAGDVPDTVSGRAGKLYRQTRPALLRWAWAKYAELPRPPLADAPSSAASPSLSLASPVPPAPSPALPPFDDTILRTFLSLTYPAAPTAPTPKTRDIAPSVQGQRSSRDLLNAVSHLLLRDNFPLSSSLTASLACAAARACRLDIFISLFGCELDAGCRLLVAARALEVLSRDGAKAEKDETVIFIVGQLVKAVTAVEAFSVGEVHLVHRCLRRLYRDLPTGVALERYMARVVLAVLAKSAETAVEHATFLHAALDHLVQSRNPGLARRVVSSIPPHLRRLEHYEALLRSSHFPLAQLVWDELSCAQTLAPQPSTFLAFLSAHAHRKAPPSALPSAQALIARLFRLPNTRTLEVYNLYLQVLVRHGSDPALRRTLARMGRKGIKPDEKTLAILASREIVRQDTQKRRAVVIGPDGEQEERVVEVRRRSRGTAQVAKVAKAVREAQEAFPSPAGGVSSASKGKNARQEALPAATFSSMAPNVLLRAVSRWQREFPTRKLVTLTRSQFGVDLAPLLAQPSSQTDEAGLLPSVSPPLPLPRADASLVHDLSWDEFAKYRRPALLTLAKAFENRSERRLGEALRRVGKEEARVVGRMKRRRRRALRQGRKGE
ncbi:hypothetical protein JCM10213v2_005606 [Rhodosporidiobolus nylandii]